MQCNTSYSLKEKCGVCALYSTQLSGDFYNCLLALQHRGQESCGVAWLEGSGNGYKIKSENSMGLVHNLFSESGPIMNGSIGIGHVRYSTTGSSVLENAQPFECNGVFIAFNGNITNYSSLKLKYSSEYKFRTDSDTELLAYLISKVLASSSSADRVFDGMKSVMSEVIGAYSLVVLDSRGRVLAARDQWGFKPFVLGKRGNDICIASESSAISSSGFTLERDIVPGEVILLENGKLSSKVVVQSEKKSFCMFEFVYFSRPDSIIEGRNIEIVREELGKRLGRLYSKIDFDVIVPVPDSGRSCAQGLAEVSGKPIREALIKNRYVHRTFIMPDDDARKKLISQKLSPIKELLQGKRIALVDDSIVRGNTMKRLVSMVRSNGVKEVHLFVSCPKIIAPCFMGIDFPTYAELIGSTKDVSEIAKELGVDSLNYMTVEELENAIGLKGSLCTACLTNRYPVFVEGEKLKGADRDKCC